MDVIKRTEDSCKFINIERKNVHIGVKICESFQRRFSVLELTEESSYNRFTKFISSFQVQSVRNKVTKIGFPEFRDSLNCFQCGRKNSYFLTLCGKKYIKMCVLSL